MDNFPNAYGYIDNDDDEGDEERVTQPYTPSVRIDTHPIPRNMPILARPIRVQNEVDEDVSATYQHFLCCYISVCMLAILFIN